MGIFTKGKSASANQREEGASLFVIKGICSCLREDDTLRSQEQMPLIPNNSEFLGQSSLPSYSNQQPILHGRYIICVSLLILHYVKFIMNSHTRFS